MRTLAVGRAGKGFFLAAILQSVVLIDTLCGGGLCVCVWIVRAGFLYLVSVSIPPRLFSTIIFPRIKTIML